LKDIIIDGQPGHSPKLTLIDRETRNPYPRHADNKKIIARLLLNIRRQVQQGEIFDDDEWGAFTDSYCDALGNREIQPDSVLDEILALLERLGKRCAAG
jgi:hypothetical protein